VIPPERDQCLRESGRSSALKNISIIAAIVFDKRLKIDISDFKWEIVGI
jgi:hypothetical protein